MADKFLTDETVFSGTIANDDLFHMVDVSDTTQNADGSSFGVEAEKLKEYFSGSLQDAYDKGETIETSGTAVSIAENTGDDSEILLEFKNNAGEVTTSVSANGKVQSKYGNNSFINATNVSNTNTGSYQKMLQFTVANSDYASFNLKMQVHSAAGLVANMISSDINVECSGNGSGGAILYFRVDNNGRYALKSGDIVAYFNSSTKVVTFYKKVMYDWEGSSYTISNYRGSLTLEWVDSFVGNLSGEVNNAWASKIEVYNDNDISVPNVIYVDSVNGVDDTLAGRGGFRLRYKTIQYAQANTTNTFTVGCTTTSGSATLTGISDAQLLNLKIGQRFTGTGIPAGTDIQTINVIGGNANTIVITKNATANGTITATAVTCYLIVHSGIYIQTSNILKDGYEFDFGNSMCFFSGVPFAGVAQVRTDFKLRGGNWVGTTSSSRLFVQGFSFYNYSIDIDIDSYYSRGTGIQIESNGHNLFRMVCPRFNAAFGIVASLTGEYSYWSGYKYGLLGGVTFNGGGYNPPIKCYSEGGIETPLTVTAINIPNQCYGVINETVVGNVNCGATSSVQFTSTIRCNTCVIGSNHTWGAIPTVLGSIYADVLVTINGSCELADVYGSVTNVSGQEVKIGAIFTGGYTGQNASTATIGDIRPPTGQRVTLSGTAQVTVNNQYSGIARVVIASGCVLRALGKFDFELTSAGTLLGTIELNGTSSLSLSATGVDAGTVGATGKIILNSSATLTINTRPQNTLTFTGGELINNNATIILARTGVEGSISTPTIRLNGGKYIQTGGQLICNNADSLSGLITMLGTGSKVVLKGQPYLKVANGLAPIQVLSNTSKDVYNYGVIDNCAIGNRIADTFSNTTYGATFAPNMIVNLTGCNSEETTNNW